MDFDKQIDRRGTDAYKWATDDPDVLPLWVADMDFEVAPPIKEALRRRVEHGVFGYVKVKDSYYEAVIEWFRRRHAWTMRREWILYTSGVVPALSAILQSQQSTVNGQQPRVLVLTPVYNCFYSSIRNSGYAIEASPLVLSTDSGSRQDALTVDRRPLTTFHIDFDDFERRAADPRVTVFLLCNPHNPAGRVWTPDELTRLGEICLRHGVFVISDEIHCELTMPGHRYTPFASLRDDFLLHSATCTSPSKAFNTAGLQIANITIADAAVRAAVDRQININEVCDVNPFGPAALEAAYSAEGEQWLDALLHYIYGNYEALRDFFAAHMPQYTVTRLEGTYLVWVDVHREARAFCRKLLAEQKVWLNEGEMYDPAGSTFVRINIACPRARLLEALRRMEKI